MGSADAVTGSLTPDGNGLRRTLDGATAERWREVRDIMDRLVMLCLGDVVHEGRVCFRGGSGALNPVSEAAVMAFACDAIPLIKRLPWTATDHQDLFAHLAPSNLGRAHQVAAAGDPLGVSGPKESVR